MKHNRWFPAVLFLLAASACHPTATPTPGPGPTPVHILEPQRNEILPLQPYTLKFESTALLGIDEFSLSVNGVFEAAIAPLSMGSCGAGCGHAFYGEYVWTPPSTGHFTISIAAFGNGQWGEAGVVDVIVMEDFLAVGTPPDLIPTPTPMMSGKTSATGKKSSNCREGGGPEFRILAVLKQGETAEIVAVSEDGLYLKVIPPRAQVECWIAIELLQFSADDLLPLPVEPFPLLPPEEPEPARTRVVGAP